MRDQQVLQLQSGSLTSCRKQICGGRGIIWRDGRRRRRRRRRRSRRRRRRSPPPTSTQQTPPMQPKADDDDELIWPTRATCGERRGGPCCRAAQPARPQPASRRRWRLRASERARPRSGHATRSRGGAHASCCEVHAKESPPCVPALARRSFVRAARRSAGPCALWARRGALLARRPQRLGGSAAALLYVRPATAATAAAETAVPPVSCSRW